MKTLDRYIAKNFLIGYVIAFAVLVGLCVIIDLFVNVDEFVENAEAGIGTVLKNIFTFYAVQSTLYFRNFAGIITVVAAIFSLWKMIRSNEFVAMMASGVSLKRIAAPILFLAILLSGLLVVDQEVIIPRLISQLVRSHDSKPGEEKYKIWFLADDKNSQFCTDIFDEKTQTMTAPMIIIRKQTGPSEWEVLGRIKADKATYNSQKKRWDLTNGEYIAITKTLSDTDFDQAPEPKPYYESSITPQDMLIRRQEGYKSLLSSAQLTALAKKGVRIKDRAELYSQKHFRISDPIINIVMLLAALPFLLCRDPKSIKTAVTLCLAVTFACFLTTLACKMVATEVFFNQIRPEFWAWLPIVIFLPIAVFQLDSMKT